MVFKDIKVQKEYQKLWYQRKKAGLPTKTRQPKSEKHKKYMGERRRRNAKNYRRTRKIKRKQVIKLILGDCCFICKRKNKLLSMHRKDGKKHKPLHSMCSKRLKKELETNKYVLLCYVCHKNVHWCLDFVGLDWHFIEEHL